MCSVLDMDVILRFASMAGARKELSFCKDRTKFTKCVVRSNATKNYRLNCVKSIVMAIKQ